MMQRGASSSTSSSSSSGRSMIGAGALNRLLRDDRRRLGGSWVSNLCVTSLLPLDASSFAFATTPAKAPLLTGDDDSPPVTVKLPRVVDRCVLASTTVLCEAHTLMPWCSIGTWHFHRPTARRVRTPVHERRRTEAPSRGDTAVGGFNQRSHSKKA